MRSKRSANPAAVIFVSLLQVEDLPVFQLTSGQSGQATGLPALTCFVSMISSILVVHWCDSFCKSIVHFEFTEGLIPLLSRLQGPSFKFFYRCRAGGPLDYLLDPFFTLICVQFPFRRQVGAYLSSVIVFSVTVELHRRYWLNWSTVDGRSTGLPFFFVGPRPLPCLAYAYRTVLHYWMINFLAMPLRKSDQVRNRSRLLAGTIRMAQWNKRTWS